MGYIHMVTASLALSNTVSTAATLSSDSNAVNVGDFLLMNLYSQYAAASYCYANNGNKPNPTLLVNCAGAKISNCQLVEKNGAKIVKTFTGLLPRNTTGFVAVDPIGPGGKGLIVVSFRGTEPFRAGRVDLKTNTDSKSQVSASQYCFNCTADSGYFDAYMSVNKSVVESVALQLNIPGQKDYQVVTTGHSLGGALATFAALELRRLNISVHLASYGMPRVGNRQLAQLINAFDPVTSANPAHKSLTQRNYRLSHIRDFVPDWVAETETNSDGRFEFRHVAPGYNITSGDNIIPTANDIAIMDDVSQSNGGSFIAVVGIPARHSSYFGNINACS